MVFRPLRFLPLKRDRGLLFSWVTGALGCGSRGGCRIEKECWMTDGFDWLGGMDGCYGTVSGIS